ncbi:alkaline shock response membrane anchor protein AmaP [Streptomyces uncialis]|uniref:alkaline shock response membrane anchor protein AmaP n=1 Tax=Streptomyces uncialis TaxID=1048205 RepID=UPI00224CFD96|nr:alkaline shock response membrane anchor protein AmaP [Streptomyces uncialis]MCX4663036.1 alkaline shock response membrane anchor protein AmaP [Streptomyces uncialis]WTE10196.1 alkaline shock response membrane anchor protein AmaP [Streptomyces uncialis]
MRPVLRTVDRVLLGLLGLVLLIAGGSVLAIGLGVRPPSWWPYEDQHDVLLSAARRTRWRDEGWWWPVVIAALAVAVLLALWWLSAVLRRRRLAEVLVDTGDGEGAVVRGRALESVLVTEAEALDGVDRAEVRLVGRRGEPGARVRLVLEPHGVPRDAVRRLHGEVLAGARTSSGSARWPSTVRIRAVKHPPERVT